MAYGEAVVVTEQTLSRVLWEIENLLSAKTPLAFSETVIELQNAAFDLSTYHPLFDHAKGQIVWDKGDDGT